MNVSRSALTNALRVAAQKFADNAGILANEPAPYRSLAEQFQRQAAEARLLADAIDNATSIQLVDEE
jgi:hypothetical protein